MVYSGRSPEPVENRSSNTPEGILYSIADTMSRVGALMSKGGAVLVVMGPEHAAIIGDKHGWSKQDVKQFLFENFKRAFGDLRRAGMKIERGAPRTAVIDGVDYFFGCQVPEEIHVVVAGGNNAGVSSVITNWGYHVPPGECILQPIAPVR
jgi:hypothetical protein